LKILFCIDMLNEGIHVEDVDAVVLCRPTISPIVYKQQIGRALATGRNREPVIFDLVNNFDSLYSVSALRDELMQLNRAYRSDEDAEDEEFIGFEIIDELRDCRELMEQIQRNLDAGWEEHYGELVKYKNSHGDIRVPKKYVTESGVALGRWLLRQRGLYNSNLLEDWRVKMFEELGMNWEKVTDQKFNHWLELLKEYKEEYGNLIIPSKYVTKEGEALGNFCFNMRSRYRRGQLSDEYIYRLTELEFKWDTFSEYWETGYIHAKAYYEVYGDINMPKRYVCEDSYKLGLWIATQRNVRAGRVRGNLNQEQISRLEELGMSWTVETNDHFDGYVKRFVEFQHKYGTAKIPSNYVTEDGWPMGGWAYRMKRDYREGKLPENKKRMLNEVGFLWDDYNNCWLKKYERAKDYYEEHGNLSISDEYIKEHGGGLSQWLNNQRKRYLQDDHGG
ncbi:MAG: Helicase associated domain protein, partial [Pseudobutyrivibrio sp.]|nr:Helicase associated domain protein [Pseudobutyrivibrio sp.]